MDKNNVQILKNSFKIKRDHDKINLQKIKIKENFGSTHME